MYSRNGFKNIYFSASTNITTVANCHLLKANFDKFLFVFYMLIHRQCLLALRAVHKAHRPLTAQLRTKPNSPARVDFGSNYKIIFLK